MTNGRKVVWGAVVLCGCFVFFIWTPLISQSQGMLTVSFLDVGQGDAIFIESPSGRQVLIDGGRDRSVLRELPEVMPWGDRTIDIVIPTHPDADHVGGLIDVFVRYDIQTVIASSVMGDTDLWRTLETEIDNEGAEQLTAARGQIIDFGDGAYMEILFPDREVPHIETNTGSVVVRLVYGETAFMLTGDAPVVIERFLLALDGEHLASDVLKAGHHGSRTSSSKEFVEAVNPDFAVISRGCGNTYGHPHEEVTALFANMHIPVLDTCKNGRITFVSDGVEVRQR